MHQPPVLARAKPLVDWPAEKPVLHDPGPGLASVPRRFGAQRFIFVLKHGQVALDPDLSSTRSPRPLSASHRRTVLSPDPLAIVPPFGLNATPPSPPASL